MDYLQGANQGVTNPMPKNAQVGTFLTMDNISHIYRYVLFAKLLGITIPDIGDVLLGFDYPADQSVAITALNGIGPSDSTELHFGDPFSAPTTLLAILMVWKRMQNLLMPWAELRYISDSVPTPHDPIAPTQLESLMLAKTLDNGFSDIQKAHPAVQHSSDPTPDQVKASLALMFDDEAVTRIMNLLRGRTTYSADAPNISDQAQHALLTVLAPKRLFKYIPAPLDSLVSASIQFVGNLSNAKIVAVKGAVNGPAVAKDEGSPHAINGVAPGQDSEWDTAVGTALAVPYKFFLNTLAVIFLQQVSTLKGDSKAAIMLSLDDVPPILAKTALRVAANNPTGGNATSV